MGARALIFCRLYPTPSTGYARLLAKLEMCLVRATAMAEEERQGTLESHVAALRKLELLRTVRTVHLAHLRHVAQIAAVDLPGLPVKFKLKRGTISYREFQVAARTLAEEALRRKDVLVQHGLAEEVLESLEQSLAEFDRRVEQGNAGRLAHVAASVSLDSTALEVVRIVRAMGDINRLRFLDNSEHAAAWRSASHVVPSPKAAPAAA
jgi:hypothetical protein